MNSLAIAESKFKLASGEAALFELRMRMLAGTLTGIQDKKIDISLGELCTTLCQYYEKYLTAEQARLLKLACTLRNKMLHCEFSTARRKLNEINPQTRGGGVSRLDFGTDVGKVLDAIAGRDVGQRPIADTTTRTLRDVFGWLQDFHRAEEFAEATSLFEQANNLLNQLVRLPAQPITPPAGGSS